MLPPSDYHIDAEGRRHGAIALMGSIGSTWLLRPDGTFWDVDFDFGKPLTPLESKFHVTAPVAGAKRYPWLAELLPPRPSDGRDCPVCSGQGVVRPPNATGGNGILCPNCSALGWVAGATAAEQQRPAGGPAQETESGWDALFRSSQ